MMVRKFIAACVLAICLASGPAEANRVLYSYTDVLGRSVDYVSPAFDGGPFKLLTPDNCVVNGALCNQAGFGTIGAFFLFFPNGVNGGGGAAAPASAAMTPGTYLFEGPDARLVITGLADTDVVYSYVDTLGRSATYISHGFYTGGFNLVTPANCVIAGALCSQAGLGALGTFFTLFPNGPTGGGGTAAPLIAATTPGSYILGDGTARLAVIGPAAVPEPATWLMLTLGFGLFGYTLRRVRQRKPHLVPA